MVDAIGKFVDMNGERRQLFPSFLCIIFFHSIVVFTVFIEVGVGIRFHSRREFTIFRTLDAHIHCDRVFDVPVQCTISHYE